MSMKKVLIITIVIFSNFGVLKSQVLNTSDNLKNSSSQNISDVSAKPKGMEYWQAAVLGIVEGVTEYLPISSTGHLVVTQRLMGIGTGGGKDKELADAFAICIQAGAILAVLGLYFKHVQMMFLGLLGKSKEGLKLTINMLIAFMPAVVIGLTFNKSIKKHLFGIEPIIGAWIVGGILILIFVFIRKRNSLYKNQKRLKSLMELTWKGALIIGFLQCVAMWPGTSRSLMTIVGGLLVGLSMPAAIEFSFLLGVLTLSAATAKDGLDYGSLMIENYGIANLFIGFILAFISALIAVKWMINYLNKHSLAIFGYYRIAIGLITLYFFSKII